MKMRPRKLVIPVGGRGVRMQPVTLAVPKEFLTVVDRPLIDYAQEEAAAAGITEIIFITGRNKSLLQQYFSVRRFPQMKFTYVAQNEPKGLGHAVLLAREALEGEPFAVLLPDMVIDAEPSCLAQLIALDAGNAVAVEPVPEEKVSSFGIVVGKGPAGRGFEIARLVEKPALGEVPSNLAISGRYVFEPEILDALETLKGQETGEIQLTDAMQVLLHSRPMMAWEHRGKTFDCGSRAGLILAGLHFGLKRPDLRAGLLAALPGITGSSNGLT